ncbi:protein-disulfide reductase DsbD [Litoribrevibacter albus]|uniref:Thiol:disulfide interchange protein DsbD 2 n=1 Tax=Litoribrevibacter albus TaxID=1473156 RepID=A0AA37S8C7_9GAMM|nr:protein-disulfide reductase DsbD [Litoribrevibacter albus]GLQ30271.1 thiol:disulfide interchange protein DsbD 2 [Litoribrevibacter albus]
MASVERCRTTNDEIKHNVIWLFLAMIAFGLLIGANTSFSANGSLWSSASSETGLFAEQEPEFLPVDEAFQFESKVGDDNRLILRWNITDGYYLYEDRLTVKDAAGNKLTFETVEGKAKEKDDPAFGLVNVYYGSWGVSVKPVVEGEVKVRYQGCADAGLCYPPTRKTAFWDGDLQNESVAQVSDSNAQDAGSDVLSPSSSSPSGSPSSITETLRSSGFFLTILMFLGLGLGLAFTPCVLPMLPILSSVVVNHQGSHKHSAFLASLSYVLGMAVTYSALGVVMAGFGDAVQMQAWLQQPWVVGVFAAIFVALALAMFGVYELQLPEVVRNRLSGVGDESKNHGLVGCVVLGAISALVVSPCVSGPLAGVLIYISTTQDMFLGGAALFAMALGMGLPLMAVVLGGRNVLPKAGVWMEQVKVVFGLLLLMMALYLVKHLFPVEILAIAVAVILLVFTIWAGVLDAVTHALYRGVLLVIFIYSVALLASGLSGKASFDAPLSFIASGSVVQAKEMKLDAITVTPGAELDKLLAQSKRQEKPIMLDVFADWCVSCFVMEKEILSKADVKEMMRGVDVVKVDITEVADANAIFLQQHRLFGPPAFLFYDAKGEQIGRIVGEVTKSEFEQYYQTLAF